MNDDAKIIIAIIAFFAIFFIVLTIDCVVKDNNKTKLELKRIELELKIYE